MKADLYVHGRFWATIDVPGDGLLALLAKGMLTEAQHKADQLQADLNNIDGVMCSIHLRVKKPVTYSDPEGRQHPYGHVL